MHLLVDNSAGLHVCCFGLFVSTVTSPLGQLLVHVLHGMPSPDAPIEQICASIAHGATPPSPAHAPPAPASRKQYAPHPGRALKAQLPITPFTMVLPSGSRSGDKGT